MEEAQMIAIVVAIVGMLKMQSARVSGLVVPLVAVVVAILVVFVYAESVPTTGLAAVALLKLGAKIGLSAVGGMHVVLYGATKVGDALAHRTGPA